MVARLTSIVIRYQKVAVSSTVTLILFADVISITFRVCNISLKHQVKCSDGLAEGLNCSERSERCSYLRFGHDYFYSSLLPQPVLDRDIRRLVKMCTVLTWASQASNVIPDLSTLIRVFCVG
jgi:hypothetical protein